MLRNITRNRHRCSVIYRTVSSDLITEPPWGSLEGLRDKWRNEDFPVKELQHFTEGDNQEKRQKFRELLSDPEFVPRYNIPLEGRVREQYSFY